MMTIIDVNDTNTGWNNEYDYPVNYRIEGLSRGFNIEYRMPDGRLDYSSVVFINGELDEDNPVVVCNFELVEMASGGIPTGRAIFRGYYYERYYGDTYYEEVPYDDFRGIMKEVS